MKLMVWWWRQRSAWRWKLDLAVMHLQGWFGEHLANAADMLRPGLAPELNVYGCSPWLSRVAGGLVDRPDADIAFMKHWGRLTEDMLDVSRAFERAMVETGEAFNAFMATWSNIRASEGAQ